jgi:hypothetical protein
MPLFSRQIVTGTGSHAAGPRYVFHGLEVQDVEGSILFDALSSAFWEKKNEGKKEKGEMDRGLFSQGRYALLAVPYQDFLGYEV